MKIYLVSTSPTSAYYAVTGGTVPKYFPSSKRARQFVGDDSAPIEAISEAEFLAAHPEAVYL